MSIPVTEHVKAALLADSNAFNATAEANKAQAIFFEEVKGKSFHKVALIEMSSGNADYFRKEARKCRKYAKQKNILSYERQQIENARERFDESKEEEDGWKEVRNDWEDPSYLGDDEEQRKLIGRLARAWREAAEAWEEAAEAWEEAAEASEENNNKVD